jgi:dihydroorotase
VRDARHREALWRAIRDGLVDVIGSDHAPHTADEKHRPYPQSPSGMPGVQTTLPLMLDHVAAGRLSLARLVDLLCAGPARIYGIAGKGRLAVGGDGDLAIVDLSAKRTIRNGEQATRVGWTPYDGVKVTGWPVATVLHGKLAMRDGQLLGEPSGRVLAFADALPGSVPLS